jgi:thioredoxin type arsenate reductase
MKRKIVAEAFGTAFLLAAVVGSGIMGDRLAQGNLAIALLANTIATGATLAALILTFGPISGAHLNPAVTLADASLGGLPWKHVPGYIAAQITGALAGVAAAHVMFGLPIYSISHHARSGWAQAFSEFVATFGLLCVIWGCSRFRSSAVAYAVAAYITGAYWFTASTSFANPAVTLARSLSDTFAGIAPADAPGFIAAELFGAGAATALFRWLTPAASAAATGVVLPHSETNQPTPKRSVLILCTGNSARSQMAEGLLRHMAGDRFQVASAGTKPSFVRPEAIAAMREVGIDLSGQRSKSVAEFTGRPFDYVITVCDNAKESCPIFPARTKRLHWPFEDPPGPREETEEVRMSAFRKVRDEMKARLAAELEGGALA